LIIDRGGSRFHTCFEGKHFPVFQNGPLLLFATEKLGFDGKAVPDRASSGELLAKQARADPLQTDKYRQALEAARVAAQLAESASAETQRRMQ
jgi:hypothetical protein